MKTKLIFIIIMIAICAISINNNAFCFELYRADRDIRGRVIDADTREPIQGVVVVAGWSRSYPTPAGDIFKYGDRHETLTDEKGEFLIPGKGIKIMTSLSSPGIGIFKAGYDSMGLHDLGEEFNKFSRYKDVVTWEGDTAIIPLKKLTMEERKKRYLPSPSQEAPLEKVILMLKEVDKEDAELGRNTRGIWHGKQYE